MHCALRVQCTVKLEVEAPENLTFYLSFSACMQDYMMVLQDAISLIKLKCLSSSKFTLISAFQTSNEKYSALAIKIPHSPAVSYGLSVRGLVPIN